MSKAATATARWKEIFDLAEKLEAGAARGDVSREDAARLAQLLLEVEEGAGVHRRPAGGGRQT